MGRPQPSSSSKQLTLLRKCRHRPVVSSVPVSGHGQAYSRAFPLRCLLSSLSKCHQGPASAR
eukprot:732291-Rhodomonas_salina.1